MNATPPPEPRRLTLAFRPRPNLLPAANSQPLPAPATLLLLNSNPERDAIPAPTQPRVLSLAFRPHPAPPQNPLHAAQLLLPAPQEPHNPFTTLTPPLTPSEESLLTFTPPLSGRTNSLHRRNRTNPFPRPLTSHPCTDIKLTARRGRLVDESRRRGVLRPQLGGVGKGAGGRDGKLGKGGRGRGHGTAGGRWGGGEWRALVQEAEWEFER